jgi:hypothetical protein
MDVDLEERRLIVDELVLIPKVGVGFLLATLWVEHREVRSTFLATRARHTSRALFSRSTSLTRFI